ncbi:hypothetical protein C8J56DRAFT_1110134 [Mycena floridula]|nr:hypothetical protein C8J56DRAFT_1110134 [Mycena floridula]
MPPRVISLLSVNIATVSIESLLYGAFLVLAFISICLSYYRHLRITRVPRGNASGRSRSTALGFFRSPMFLGAFSLLVTVTGHWICIVMRIFDAFIHYKHGQSPEEYFGDISQMTEVVKTAFLMATMVLSDLMIIYRLWIVWNHNRYIVIFPLMSVLGLTVCGVGVTYQFYIYDPSVSVFNSAAARWITSDCVFTLATNLYSTSMIAWRLWDTNRIVGNMRVGGGRNNVMTAIVIVIESAAIYTTWTILFMALYESNTNYEFSIVDTWPSVAGIAFMLINVRVGLGWAQNAEFTSHVGGGASNTRIQDSGNYRLRPLAVNISHIVEQDDANEYSEQKDLDLSKNHQSV